MTLGEKARQFAQRNPRGMVSKETLQCWINEAEQTILARAKEGYTLIYLEPPTRIEPERWVTMLQNWAQEQELVVTSAKYDFVCISW